MSQVAHRVRLITLLSGVESIQARVRFYNTQPQPVYSRRVAVVRRKVRIFDETASCLFCTVWGVTQSLFYVVQNIFIKKVKQIRIWTGSFRFKLPACSYLLCKDCLYLLTSMRLVLTLQPLVTLVRQIKQSFFFSERRVLLYQYTVPVVWLTVLVDVTLVNFFFLPNMEKETCGVFSPSFSPLICHKDQPVHAHSLHAKTADHNHILFFFGQSSPYRAFASVLKWTSMHVDVLTSQKIGTGNDNFRSAMFTYKEINAVSYKGNGMPFFGTKLAG